MGRAQTRIGRQGKPDPIRMLFAGLMCLVSPHLSANSVDPGHVYATVQTLIGEIELLRFEMGVGRASQAPVRVDNVTPQEVYFQAQALFGKINRLSYERTRATAAVIPSPESAAVPGDVLRVVRAALERLRHIKQAMGIQEVVPAKAYDPGKRSTDVYREIARANRQLNLLLIQRFNPSDVYEQVTLAIGYAARLLSVFPGERIVQAPARERGKTARDVYLLLVETLARVQRIADASGVAVLSVEVNREALDAVVPSDVYDLAVLVVAELDQLHKAVGTLDKPRAGYYPGTKVPSDVYQRVGLLNRQLRLLGERIEVTAHWPLRQVGN